MPPEVRIVLVEPRDAASIGAVARAMSHFGFGSLWIAGVAAARSDDEATGWARSAGRIVERARCVDSIEDSIPHPGRSLLIRRSRDDDVRHLHECETPVGGDPPLAVVFEPDERDLTVDERMLVGEQRSVSGSGLSVAQRVALTCWELSAVKRTRGTPVAGAAEDALARIDRGLDSIASKAGSASTGDESLEAVRAILRRAEPTGREATLILGVLRQLTWALDAAARTER